MNRTSHKLTSGMIFLLIGFSLTIAVYLFTPHTTRANPGILYAAPASQGSGNCSSWDNACTLQTALSNAVSGDEIWVKSGVHTPGASRTDTFTLKNDVAVYGGFAGTETDRSQRDWTANVTILSGDIDGNDTNTDGNGIAETWTDIAGSNSIHVVIGSGTNASAVLDGFVITAGQANDSNPNNRGGGMYLNIFGSPTLNNIIFSGNTASLYGGGIYMNNNCNPTLNNITFINNSANYGGGMYNGHYSFPKLTTITFKGNSATTKGGGLYNYSANPTLTNVIFDSNSAGENGGGIFMGYYAQGTLTNVTFYGNSASTGGGIYNWNNSNPILVNIIMWGDTASSEGPEIYNDESTPVVSYSDIQGCIYALFIWSNECGSNGGGNIASDPLFGSPASGNLRLRLNSPAIDAGNNAAVPSEVTTDADGSPRFFDITSVPNSGSGTPPIVDMGAYEARYILYAAPAAQGNNSCSSWENACTLKTALLRAVNGNEIWVKAGVHTAGTSRTDTFALVNNVAVYGGFSGIETNRSQRDWTANVTILSGDIDHNDNHGGDNIIENTSQIVGSNSYHVVTGSGTNTSAVLNGFVITAGQGDGSFPNDRGGGMYNSTGSPTLTNITFSGNAANYGGGILNNKNSSPTLTNAAFNGNAANYGGGILNNENSSPTLTNAAFNGNAASYGGGIYNSISEPTLTNISFSNNSATDGGGIYNFNSSGNLTNISFSSNSATSNGGGIYNILYSSPTLTNITFYSNSAATGGGIFNNNSSPVLTNIILWGDTASSNGPEIYNNNSTPVVSYSDIQGCGGSSSWNSACGTDGGGNIDSDPLFMDAPSGNLRLQLTSPAIDAGNNAAVPSGVTSDLDNAPRFLNVSAVPDTGSGTPPIVDMGAFEAWEILYAAPAAQGNHNCASWNNACTLQTALTMAKVQSGSEIWVKKGLHKPGTDLNDTFSLKNGIAIYGGFAGNENDRSQRNWAVNTTILSGDIDGNDTNTDSNGIAETWNDITGNNSYHVVTSSGTDSSAILDGFVITAGQANDSYPNDRGGGILNDTGSPTLTNITFSGNAASYGGGLFTSNTSSLTLTNMIFSGNMAASGGGMYSIDSSPVLANVIFFSNSATSGGGVCSSNSSSTLTNATFYGNSADTGGGMYNSNSSLVLTNAILWGDNASNSPEIYNDNSTFAIAYSDIQGCGGSSSWNSACGTDGGGNIDSDPLFVDPASGNLHLELTSPAIDAGSNGAMPSWITTDLTGKPRFLDISSMIDTGSGTPPIVDMGAYEARHFYAASSGRGSGDCTSWENACTLQTALSEAQILGGEEIWVEQGVHIPGSSRIDTFALKRGTKVYGGFAGIETIRSQRNWTANPTILSGDIDGNDTNTDGNGIAETWNDITGNNSYHVVTSSGTDSSAMLDGFIITAGQANGSNPNDRGGGMYNNTGSPMLTNVTFSGNAASYGGGMYNDTSSPTLTNVTFSGNTAGSGSGIYNDTGSPNLTNAAFYDNVSTMLGGGMYNEHSSPILRNVIFSNNKAGMEGNTFGGGGMFNFNQSSPTLNNVIFSNNWAGSYGGGMWNYYIGNPILNNVTFSNNSATSDGGGLYNNEANPTLNNVIIWGNTAPTGGDIYNSSSTPKIYNSDIQGCGGSSSWNSACGTDGGGNIDSNPLFVDAPSDNLRLNFASPAIDTGQNASCPSADLDGLPRPADGNGDGASICDMGAYEAGSMHCSISEGSTVTFAEQSGVEVQVGTQGDLACLYVDEMALNHPNATSGIQTERYWLIRGLQSDKQTAASGFSINLTLPTIFTPNETDKVCRYTGSGQVWDCAMSSFTSSSITRDGITVLSDWAVGSDVSPTVVEVSSMKAQSPASGSALTLGFSGLILALCVRGVLRRRKRFISGKS